MKDRKDICMTTSEDIHEVLGNLSIVLVSQKRSYQMKQK